MQGTEGRTLKAKELGHIRCHKGSEEAEVAFLGGSSPFLSRPVPQPPVVPGESSRGSCVQASKEGGLVPGVSFVFLFVCFLR